MNSPSNASEIMKTWRRLIRSFTLLELLMVVAIISVLSALMMPAINTAKDSAKRARCQSNLHQIGLAVQMYINDKASYLPFACTIATETPPYPGPHPPYLQDLIRPYLSGPDVGMGTNSGVFICPSVKMGWVLTTNPRNDYRYNWWFCNGWNLSTPSRIGITADRLTGSSSAVIVFDMAWNNWAYKDLPHKGVDAVYADGHAGFVDGAWFIVNGDEQTGSFCSSGFAP